MPIKAQWEFQEHPDSTSTTAVNNTLTSNGIHVSNDPGS